MFLSSGIHVSWRFAVDVRPQVMSGDAGRALDGQNTFGRDPTPRSPVVNRGRFDAELVGERLLAASCFNGELERGLLVCVHVQSIRSFLIFCQQGKPKTFWFRLR